MSSPMGKGFDSTVSSGLGGCGASDVLAVAGALVAVGETGRGADF
jgi:hypothetical protein